MKKEIIVLVGIALCTLLLISPALASGVDTLEIYGNANEDDTIDMRDLTYVKLIFFGKKPETELADAKYDGKINPLDFIQIKLIIVGKEKELTLVDSADRIVTVKKPIKGIVVINSDIVETMRSIKATDKIVGVGKYMIDKKIFFSEFSGYPNVGKVTSPDIEKILELRPDAVFFYATIWVSKLDEIQNKIESADPNIKVIRFDCFKPESYVEEVKKLGYVLGKKEKADEFLDFYNGIRNTIGEGVEVIPKENRPKVYFESRPYRSCGEGTGWNQKVTMAGGNNIFEDLKGYFDVDPEEVIKRNPEIMIRQPPWGIGGYATDDITELSDIHDEIMRRPELANVTAVRRNKRVYIIAQDIFGGVMGNFVGMAYMAKWFHPELFKDLDPEAIHQEYLTRFQGLDYDLDKHGVFVYPEPS